MKRTIIFGIIILIIISIIIVLWTKNNQKPVALVPKIQSTVEAYLDNNNNNINKNINNNKITEGSLEEEILLLEKDIQNI